VLDRALAEAADVWREHDVLELSQLRGGRRLVLEDVERGRPEAARAK